MDNLKIYNKVPEYQPYSLTQGPQRAVYSSGSPNYYYNKEYYFKVQNYGYVESFFLKITLTTTDTSSSPTPTAVYIPNFIQISSAGVPFSVVTTLSSLANIDRLDNRYADYYSNVANADVLGTTASTITHPLFFSFNGQLLDLDTYKDITITVLTEPNKEAMGFEYDIDYLSIELVTNYLRPKEKVPIYLGRLRNYYQLNDLIVSSSSGTTQIENFFVNVPFEIINAFFIVKSTDLAKNAIINYVKFYYTNGATSTFDSLSYTRGISFNDAGSFICNFGKAGGNSWAMSNGNLNPIKAEINFTPSETADYYISCCLEYNQEIELDSEGHIHEIVKNSFV